LSGILVPVYGVCVRNVFGILCECCVYGCGVYVSGVCVCEWFVHMSVCMRCMSVWVCIVCGVSGVCMGLCGV